MTTVESDIQNIRAGQETVYNTLADLRNLERVKEHLPTDKLSEFEVDEDTCRIGIDPVGTVTIRIVDREPFSTIRFDSEQSIIPFNLWITLYPIAETETQLKVTFKADIPTMAKIMLGDKLEKFTNQFAEQLAKINYD